MKFSQTPETITEDESDLGFKRFLIEGIEEEVSGKHVFLHQPIGLLPVVARILSPYEILLKIYYLDDEIAYTHQQFGYTVCALFSEAETENSSSQNDWYPVSNPYHDAARFLLDYDIGTHRIGAKFFPSQFFPVEFKYRPA